MKLSNLGRFFHKRSRSDSALYRRAQPEVQLPPRPVSVSFSNGLVLPLDTQHSLFSELLSGVPVTPLTVSIPQPVSSSAVSSASQISAASQPVVIDALARRIQELEDTMRSQEQSNTRPSSVDSPSESAQDTLRDAEQRNSQLVDEVAQLRSELELTRIELDTLRTDHTRARGLLDIPVLSSILAQVSSGADAEDALVAAIKAAVAEPGSAWRALLEPVTGPRAPEDYIAQVHCTLRARREGRAWQKRAAFWRHSAKADGAHEDTVTPSASALSEVVDALGVGRRSTAGAAPARLCDSGTVVSLVQVQVQVEVVEQVEQVEAEKAATESVESPSTSLSPVREAAGSQPSPPPAAEDPFSSGTVKPKPALEHSETAQTVTEARDAERTVPRPCANLQPLASVTFRESHSIRSLSPKKEGALVASASTLSRKSAKSSRASVPAEPSTPKRVPEALIPSDCSSGSLSSSTSSAASGAVLVATSPSAPPPDTSRETAGSDFSSTSWDLISTFINKSLSFSSLARTLGSSPAAASRPGPADVGSFAPPSPRPPQPAQSPPRPTRIPSPPGSAGSTPASSPAKKSRLPLPTTVQRVVKSAMPQTARIMRRFSRQIGKPVLVDSTNAAAVGDAAPGVVRVAAARGHDKSRERGGRGAPRKMSDAARGAGKENAPSRARGRSHTIVRNGGLPAMGGVRA